MTDKNRLLKQLSEYYFAKYETELFLDTHPTNKTALQAREKYREKYDQLLEEYQQKYNMLSTNAKGKNEDRWTWIDDPWPWD